MQRFLGKVVTVTGGAAGIGEASVRRFVAEGASVGFCDRNEARGEALRDALSSEGGNVRFQAVDVADAAAAQAFVRQTAEHFGRFDVLVNNAGIRNYQTIVEASEESWDEILGVNLMGYVYCTKAAIPAMEATGGGAIVNVASIRSLIAGSKTVQYDTAKAAILGLTRSTARDHAAQGIRVNAVGPGPIYTDFHAGRAQASSVSEGEFKARFGADTLLKRPGTPEEIASAITFLASDEASFVTGTCLYVDGGATAYGDGR